MLSTVLPIMVLSLLLGWSGSATAQAEAESAADVPVEGIFSATPDSVVGPVPALLAAEEVDLWSTGVSPAGAVLMSPIFPGWGQLYSENGWRGALSFGSQMWFWSRLVTRDQRAVRARNFAETFAAGDANRTLYNQIAEENWEQMRDYAWWSAGAMFIISLDAYVGSHLFNFDEDPVPVPNRYEDIFDQPGGSMPGSVEVYSIVVMQWQYRF